MTPWHWIAAAPASAPVTQWPLRILLVVLVAGVIALVLLAMRSGWRGRALRQAGIPAPPLPPEDGDEPPTVSVAGVFLGTTRHGDWLDRIVVHDLGVRSRAAADVGRLGVALRRVGARDVLIPAGSLRSAGLARGIAGKAYERDGVVVITWELGGAWVDTGFRADAADGQEALLAAVLDLVSDRTGRGVDDRASG